MENKTDCPQCDYVGEMTKKMYYKNGNIRFCVCPVCYTKTIINRNQTDFKYRCSLKSNLLYAFLGVFGVACGIAGVLVLLGEGGIAAKITIGSFIVGGFGIIKYLNIKEDNQFLNRRIAEFKKFGEIPD